MTKAEEIAKKWGILHYESGEVNKDVLEALNEALRQPPVMRSVCCNEELVRFKTYGYDECVGCGSTYRHTDA